MMMIMVMSVYLFFNLPSSQFFLTSLNSSMNWMR